jgi:hypothetical protein
MEGKIQSQYPRYWQQAETFRQGRHRLRVTDGPFAEAKEIVAGFMIVAADDYDGAVAVVQAMPMMQMPGACVEIREMASF